MIELKPCPFCGKKQSEWSCDCACGNPALDSMTRGAWNNRPIEDDLRARAEKAERMCERLIKAGNSLCDLKPFIPPDIDIKFSNWKSIVAEYRKVVGND